MPRKMIRARAKEYWWRRHIIIYVLLFYNRLLPARSAPAAQAWNVTCPGLMDATDDCSTEAIMETCATARDGRLPGTYQCYCAQQIARPCAQACVDGPTFDCLQFCSEYVEKVCTSRSSSGYSTDGISEGGLSTAMHGNLTDRNSEGGLSTGEIIATAVAVSVVAVVVVAAVVYCARTPAERRFWQNFQLCSYVCFKRLGQSVQEVAHGVTVNNSIDRSTERHLPSHERHLLSQEANQFSI